LQDYARLERENAERDVERAYRAFTQLVKELHNKSIDWSNWDDTYRFMADRNHDYQKSNLGDDSLIGLQLDAMFFVDARGKLFESRRLKHASNLAPPQPEAVIQALGLNQRQSKQTTAETNRSGILMAQGTPLMVSIRPILTSMRQGPARGWIVFARYFDAESLKELCERTRLQVALYDLSRALPGDDSSRFFPQNPNAPVHIQPLSATEIAGYTVLKDINGQPIQRIYITLARNIYQQGMEAMRYLFVVIGSTTIAFGVVMMLTLQKYVLSRVWHLTQQVERIGTTEETQERVSLSGRDEMARLSGRINAMLDTLSDNARQLRASEDHLRRYSENLERIVLDRTDELATAEAEMRALAQLQKAILNSAPYVILSTDTEDTLVMANNAAERLLGASADALCGKAKMLTQYDPMKVTLFRQKDGHELGSWQITTQVEQDARAEMEWVFCRPEGSPLPMQFSITPLTDERGEVTGYLYIGEDISERKQSEREIRRMYAALQNAVEGIAEIDQEGRYCVVNAAYAALLERAPTALIGSPWQQSIPTQERERLHSAYLEMREKGKAEVELQGERSRGGAFYVQMTLIASRNQMGEFVGHYCFLKDITERKALEARITYQAYHDALTGLPNRARFHDRVERALAQAVEQKSRMAALFIDLDNFKFVNDSMGHEEGDRLLITVAKRLQECVRPCDIVARLGGDEFTVLLEEVASPEDATTIAKRILSRFQEPIILSKGEVVVSPSIGIALSSETCSDRDALLQQADTAMYEAKMNGKAGYVLFDEKMTERITERIELETGLRHAVEREELRLYYQPIINLETGEIVGAEALVRWEHPTKGLVSPAKFIPLAEETGLILPIGAWVLEEACRQVVAWQRQFRRNGSPFIIGVNLSARQIQSPDIVDQIAQIVQKSGIDPSCLKLEITESMMLTHTESMVSKLHMLKALGVHLAMDDFGTGYSSLSYLQRLPLDTVKIDQAFVRMMGNDVQPAAIILSVIRMCRALGMNVICEGVENTTQVAQLQALGCDMGQGYHFSRPLVAQGFTALLQQGHLSLAAPEAGANWNPEDYIYLAA
jgi:diguanylate cyclase (GGDEF)-like protein/PAS domain S-box-containing protein